MNFRMMGVFYYCFINNVKFIISGPALPEIDMFEFSAWITDSFFFVLSCSQHFYLIKY